MLRQYLLMTTLGYFGIKIANGSLKTLPPKPTDSEIPDFVVAMVMGGVLYFLNNMEERTVLSSTIVWLYYFAFGVGLTIPFAKANVLDKMDEGAMEKLKWGIYAVLTSVVLITIYLTFTTQLEDGILYLLYLLCIALVAMGLVFTHKKSRIFPVEDAKTGKAGKYEVPGQSLSLSLPMVAWLISLIFVADSESGTTQTFLVFLQGIFYGIFVGGISLYGMNYILSDDAPSKCVGDYCKIDGMIVTGAPYQNLTKEVRMIKWVLGLAILVMMVMITLFYTSAAEFLPFSS